MESPKISIIMAVFNGEKYLHFAIDSVIEQDFIDYELIIIDDCSKDSTAEIISSYSDNRIKYIRNQVNLGQTPSLNIGLKSARAKYIARIDADDIYLPGKLSKQFEFMEKNKNIVVCGTNGYKIDENGKVIGKLKVPQEPKDISFHLFYGSPMIHVSVLMRKSPIIEIGGYDEKYPYCADFALWSKLIKKKYQICNLPYELIQFRTFKGSLGAINKLGPSGIEATNIIFSNISNRSNLFFSKKECETILFMLWPSAGCGIIEITNVYKKLKSLAKEFYDIRVPFNTRFRLNIMYLKSLVKRGLYYRSHNKFRLIRIEFFILLRSYRRNPIIIIMALITFISILFFSEKNIKRFA